MCDVRNCFNPPPYYEFKLTGGRIVVTCEFHKLKPKEKENEL